jgi:hypothetical protein
MLPAMLFTFAVFPAVPVIVMFETLIVAGIGARTVIAAAPLTLASAVEVAVTDTAPGETAVTTPVVETVAIALSLVAQLTVRATPASASTFATKACVSPGFMTALGGETSTLRTAGATTVIVTLAFFDASAVDVAVMLAEPAPTAVTRPSAFTDATLAALDVQDTASFAESWIVAPTEIGPVGAPEIASPGPVTDTSSPQAASPASAPTAINDRKSFCILIPLLECEYLHVRNESTIASPDSGDAPRPGTTTATIAMPTKDAMRPLSSMTGDPTTLFAVTFCRMGRPVAFPPHGIQRVKIGVTGQAVKQTTVTQGVTSPPHSSLRDLVSKTVTDLLNAWTDHRKTDVSRPRYGPDATPRRHPTLNAPNPLPRPIRRPLRQNVTGRDGE